MLKYHFQRLRIFCVTRNLVPSYLGSPGDTRSTVSDNFTLMKSDDTASAGLPDTTRDSNNVITTFDSLESEIGQGSSEKKMESPTPRRRRAVPAVPQVTMGKHNEPK